MKDRVLFIDDDQSQCDMFELALSRLGYDAVTTTSPLAAIERSEREPFDAILTDLEMPDIGGIELCRRVLSRDPSAIVIVVTGQGSVETAVGAMRAGAYDFLTKPVDDELLGLSLARALQHRRLSAEVERLRGVSPDANNGGPILGDSSAIRRVVDLVGRVGPTDASVLLVGETGTGKELVARALHDKSAHASGPFVAINCAAVPATLLESELFGHAKGAFTDAKSERQGLFLEAQGGTLFLDEIGEMPLEMQAKLLRALQERVVRPVGSNIELPFDARLIAATHQDIELEVENRRFRQDLFYRINVVRIDVPALRERGGDVLRLAAHFLERSAARAGKTDLFLSAEAAERLLAYDWPGNVRELENCIERAVALARLDRVTVDDLPEKIRTYRPDSLVLSTEEPGDIVPLREIERRYILRVIKAVRGNKARAAQLLGLDRRTLYRRLEKYSAGTNKDALPVVENGVAGGAE